MSEKKESIGAWKKTTKDGKEVINFTINGQRYNMWVNQYKDKPAQPDFKIYEDNYVAPTQQTQSQPKQEFKPLSDDDLF